MSLTLNLPPELESTLSSEAENLGLPLAEYALRLLSAGRVVECVPKTGAELVAYWQREGLVGTKPDIIDSQEHARQVRHKAQNRSRE